jgi:hypothetical protein
MPLLFHSMLRGMMVLHDFAGLHQTRLTPKFRQRITIDYAKRLE